MAGVRRLAGRGGFRGTMCWHRGQHNNAAVAACDPTLPVACRCSTWAGRPRCDCDGHATWPRIAGCLPGVHRRMQVSHGPAEGSDWIGWPGLRFDDGLRRCTDAAPRDGPRSWPTALAVLHPPPCGPTTKPCGGSVAYRALRVRHPDATAKPVMTIIQPAPAASLPASVLATWPSTAIGTAVTRGGLAPSNERSAS